jgi:hypothetical protein
MAGMDLSRLDLLEERLREDILREAAQFQGNILLHDELSNSEVIAVWESVSEHTVKTPRSVRANLVS